jgi:hypothetical protein
MQTESYKKSANVREMMRLLNKVLCKLLGHKWRPKLKDMYCIRCGVSRPKTLEEKGSKINECEVENDNIILV